ARWHLPSNDRDETHKSFCPRAFRRLVPKLAGTKPASLGPSWSEYRGDVSCRLLWGCVPDATATACNLDYSVAGQRAILIPEWTKLPRPPQQSACQRSPLPV